MDIYYHYTTKSGAEAIKISKTILKSLLDGRDAILGEGVYFSTLDPKSHTKKEIAEDNWGNAGQYNIDIGKMDMVIKVQDLRPVTPPKRKGVVIYEDDVNLDEFEYTIERSYFSDSSFLDQIISFLPF